MAQSLSLRAPHALSTSAMLPLSIEKPCRLAYPRPSSLVEYTPRTRISTARIVPADYLGPASPLKHIGSFFALHLLEPSSLIRSSLRQVPHGTELLQLYPHGPLLKDGHKPWHIYSAQHDLWMTSPALGI